MPLFVNTYEGTYTPTGTGMTLSTGTITGRWSRTDRDVRFSVLYTWGTGDTFTGSGTPFTFTLPFTASLAMYPSQMNAWIEDVGTNVYQCVCGPGAAADTTHTPGVWQGGIVTTPTPDVIGISNWATNQPMTWAAGDHVYVSGWFTAAS